MKILIIILYIFFQFLSLPNLMYAGCTVGDTYYRDATPDECKKIEHDPELRAQFHPVTRSLKTLIGPDGFKACNNEIYEERALLLSNPYDVNDKCYLINTFQYHIQILDRTHALFITDKVAMHVDFGKLSAPVEGGIRMFLVKGKPTPFKYKTALGSLIVATKVKVIKELQDPISGLRAISRENALINSRSRVDTSSKP